MTDRLALLRAAVSPLLEGDEGHFLPEAAADRLIEESVTLAEWCCLYADWPEPVERLQQAWAAWLKCVEPYTEAPQQPGRRESFTGYRWRHVQVIREGVQRALMDIAAEAVMHGHEEVMIPKDHPAAVAAEKKARAAVALDRKRRVLGLFPEVLCVRGFHVSGWLLRQGPEEVAYCEREIARRIKDWPRHVSVKRRWDEGSGHFIYQETPAPDLLPTEYGPSTLKAAWPAFQARQMIEEATNACSFAAWSLLRDDGPLLRDPRRVLINPID